VRRALLPLFLLLVSPAFPAPCRTLYGHLCYDEADPAALAEAGPYRQTGRKVMMTPEAAAAFRRMVEGAAADGVHIIPISGFRPVAYQVGLWQKAIAKRGSEAAAAKWVAPPGHSEHHTGLTLDLGDGDAPETDVETSFETTKAFAWLTANASRFGFQISFPKDNVQGVSYEPWHWRFIGTDEARRRLHPAS
jgi:D-alanyl-D-alanine carboxypeptidase